MSRQTILVVGSINMDQVVDVPHLPVMGETLLGASALKLIPGGKGANQAVAMARLGGQVAMAGRVGSDPFGTQSLQALRNDGVATDLVAIDPAVASGVAFIFLASGDNAIVVASGANAHVGKESEQYARIQQSLRQASALVLQLEIPLETVSKLITVAHQAGVMTVLNLAPAHKLPEDILRQVSVLVVNESEASLLSGQPVESLDEARSVARQLHTAGIPLVVITLGSRGAVLVTTDQQGNVQTIYQTAPDVKVVDTTAAGDCFVGALTVALTEEQSPEAALHFAIMASALKVTRFGAQSGLPTRPEVLAFEGTQP
ncbi:ribokinase [Dictyobacter alpinus]|uniref:Ribokinase n=1 Tax=Dictyobacter alpinus TaxID=2014873 RepID=A0A402B798_9CHLR|nr:ribokinase [Dictyobacter alpinus]GCE27199.1 ribokinase [Dictyobacter alpinus]